MKVLEVERCGEEVEELERKIERLRSRTEGRDKTGTQTFLSEPLVV